MAMPSSTMMLSARPPARRWFSFKPCALICADTATFRLLQSIARRTRPRAPAGAAPYPIRHPPHVCRRENTRSATTATNPFFHTGTARPRDRVPLQAMHARTALTPYAYAYAHAHAGDGFMHTDMRTVSRSSTPPARPPTGGVRLPLSWKPVNTYSHAWPMPIG